MLKFVRVFAGADPAFDAHLAGVKETFLAAFPFHPTYTEKIDRYARGEHPPGAEAIILAALEREKTLGFSIARHIYWLQAEEPELFDAAEAILCFPQYWVWRLTGRPLAEWSYLGAHSQLWAPLARDYSSLVDALGWRGLFPEIAPAGAVVGTTEVTLPDGSTRTLSVHNGVHDSNAALAYYRMTGLTGFTLVSTGTWVIIINLDCPLDALDGDRDMIANVTVRGEPAPSLRFMGGREFDRMMEGRDCEPSEADRRTVTEQGIMLLPSVERGTGPFPHARHRWTVEPGSPGQRKVALSRYLACMTDTCLSLIGAQGPVIVEGPFAANPDYVLMLASARRTAVEIAPGSTGTSIGAALLCLDGPRGPETGSGRIEPDPVLAECARQWRSHRDDEAA